MRHRLGGSEGSASSELVVLVVPIMMLAMFAVLVGRVSSTHQEVTSVARDAARAAALRQNPAEALADADRVAREAFADRGVSCKALRVGPADGQSLDLSPGGVVRIRVECDIGLEDLVGFGLPGTKTESAESSAVVDHFRGGE